MVIKTITPYNNLFYRFADIAQNLLISFFFIKGLNGVNVVKPPIKTGGLFKIFYAF
jgi:hypothetical protein